MTVKELKEFLANVDDNADIDCKIGSVESDFKLHQRTRLHIQIITDVDAIGVAEVIGYVPEGDKQ